ncbi:MAG: hypothetical protein ACQERJ_01630, partial [Bacillota bacterium]
MSIRDLLELREVNKEDNLECQSTINISRIESSQDCLENNLHRFFELTYPSQLIKELVQFINSNMKNNKMRYRDNDGVIIICGQTTMGKTHALLAAYNLFEDFDIAESWLNQHNIRFNRFNAFAIKNKSKNCIISAANEAEEKIWVPIFEKFQRKELLEGFNDIPGSNLMRDLVQEEATAIFIDDLEAFFVKLNELNKDELLADNKQFIRNLLVEAAKNDKLMVFISTLGENEEIRELLSDKDIKDAVAIGQKPNFIFYRLFNEIKDQQFITNITPIIDNCIDNYRQADIDILNLEKFKDDLINSYPFHPQLLSILQDISHNCSKETAVYKNQIGILADLVTELGDKDLIIVSDLNIDKVGDFFPELNNAVQFEIKNFDSDNQRRILKTILLYTIAGNKEATRDKILEGVIRARDNVDIIKLTQEFENLIEQSNYIDKKEESFFIKPKKGLNTLIKEQEEQISKKEVKESLKQYISDYIFDENYKFYSNKDWQDNKDLDYILLLDPPTDTEELAKMLNEQVYTDLTYKNSLVFITAQERIFEDKYFNLMFEILATKNLIKEQSGEEKDKLQQLLEENKEKLIKMLTSTFGYYLNWFKDKGEFKLEKIAFDLKQGESPQEISEDKSRIKEYLLNIEQNSINIEKFLRQAKENRELPIISNDDLVYQVVEELIATEGFVYIKDSNKLYKSLSVLVTEQVKKVNDNQARNKLIEHLKFDLFDSEYKIYGEDQISDIKELQAVIILEDMLNKDDLREFLEEKIYANLNYENTLLLIKSNQEIFTEENITAIKREISLEKMINEGQEIENAKGLLADHQEQIINKLKGSFGEHINWVRKNGELLIEKETIDNKDFSRKQLIEKQLENVKETILSKINQLKSSIELEDLLLDFKKNRAKPIVDAQHFYKIIDELKEQGLIHVDKKSDQVYSDFLISLKEKIDELEIEDVKSKVVSLLRENVLEENHKIYGYDELEDSFELEYLLLLMDFTDQDELVQFLENEVYQEREFENSVIVIRAKEGVFAEEIIAKTKELLATEMLIAENENYTDDILLTTKSEIIEELRNKFGYYEKWTSSEEGLALEEKEIELADIPADVEVSISELKKHLIKNLRSRNVGIDIEQLFLEYRTNRSYPVILDQDLFNQSLEELIAEEKIISAEDDTQVYGNTSALIKSSVQQIDNQAAKEGLVLYIRDEFFNGDYQVFGYDDLADNPAVKYLLLLGCFKNKAKLQQVLEDKLYQGRDYKNNIVLYSSNQDVFEEENLEKMKLVLGIERAQEKINWEQSKIGKILEKRKSGLNNQIEELFGDYLYWKTVEGKLELATAELDGCLRREELIKELEVDQVELKADIIERLKELEGITSEELLSYYKKFRDYPLITTEDKFYRALAELKEEEKVLAEEDGKLHLSPLIAAEKRVRDFSTAEVKDRIVSLLQKNVLTEEYKIHGYDKLKDNSELEYLLLLDEFSDKKELVQFLEEQIYQEREFENSLVVIRSKDGLLEQEIVEKAKKLLAAETLIKQNKILNYSEDRLSDLKDNLISALAAKFGYYEKWTSSDEGLVLKEEEVELTDIPANLEVSLSELKEDLIKNLRSRNEGVDIEQLFLEYRTDRSYPVIVDQDLFNQSLEELIAEEKIISAEDDNQVYGNTSALIKSSVQQVNNEEAKQRLVHYIRTEFFNGDYQVFGYDELTDDPELKYMLILKNSNNQAKLQETLEEELYQGRDYKNNIVLYSSNQDVFKEENLEKMKLVLGIERAQEKINWEQSKIGRILEKRKDNLNQQLEELFGEYLYWETVEGKLELATAELEGCLSSEELIEELEIDKTELKADIIERLKELEGITSENLLTYYKKFRDYPLLTREDKFYQAVSELKEEKKVLAEEGGRLHLSPLIAAGKKAEDFAVEDVKERIVSLLKEDVLEENYRVYGYDQIEDSPTLKGLLLLKDLSDRERLIQFLENEVYQEREFENSLVVIRAKADVFTEKIIADTKELLAAETLIKENKDVEYIEELLLNKKVEIIDRLAAKFGYYERWSSSEEGLVLEEEEVDLKDALNKAIVDSSELKEHLIKNLRSRNEGVDIEQLFLEYRTDRSYPVIVD